MKGVAERRGEEQESKGKALAFGLMAPSHRIGRFFSSGFFIFFYPARSKRTKKALGLLALVLAALVDFCPVAVFFFPSFFHFVAHHHEEEGLSCGSKSKEKALGILASAAQPESDSKRSTESLAPMALTSCCCCSSSLSSASPKESSSRQGASRTTTWSIDRLLQRLTSFWLCSTTRRSMRTPEKRHVAHVGRQPG